MKYLIIFILPIVFLLGCKKPEEVKPENIETKSNYYIYRVIHNEKSYYVNETVIPIYSNDTIFCYLSNL